MDQPPYEEVSKDFISIHQTGLFHGDRQTNIITAVSTHNIDKHVSVDTRRQYNSPQVYILMKDMLYRLELPPHHFHQLQTVDVSHH